MEKRAGRLALHVPSLAEMWYRQKLMSDPETMSYNRGYDLSFEGYHRDTGCIDFPESEWERAHRRLTERAPEQWYAYLVRKEDGEFVGEVNVHRSTDGGWYDMGIVVEACRRGQGYGHEGLALLLEYAFEELGVPELRNDFEDTRESAFRIHIAAGFRVCGREDGGVQLALTREEYEKRQRECFT